MTSTSQLFSEGFWAEDGCTGAPPNSTWKDHTSNDLQGPSYKNLYIPIPLAFLMLGLRYFLERCLFAPIGASLGIKSSRLKKAPSNAVLDKAYSTDKLNNHKQIQGLAKQLDWTERNVERWLRLRKSQDRPSTLVKFCENCWRFSFYLSSFICGVVNLWDKPWLWNTKECWYLYPHQSIPDGIWWHSMMTLTFYWSALFSHFFDVKRKDFWQMFAHHIATIVLMSLSRVSNFHRIESLIVLAHDCGDIFLEATKMTKYADYQQASNIIFGLFIIVWVITRLVVFPFALIRSTAVEAPRLALTFPGHYIIGNGFLILLFALNVFWTYLILQLAHKALKSGQIGRDIRSSSSDYSEDSKSANN